MTKPKGSKPRAVSVRNGKDLAKKIAKAAGVKVEKAAPALPKVTATVKGKTLASDSDVLLEARTIAVTIRGLRHREDGLAGELKEVRAKITTQTDHLNSLLLDAAAGQTRLPLGEKTVDLAPTKVTGPDGAESKIPPAKGGRWLKCAHGERTLSLHEDRGDWVATLDGQQVGKFSTPGAAEGALRDKVGVKPEAVLRWTEDGKALEPRTFKPAATEPEKAPEKAKDEKPTKDTAAA